MLPERCTEKHGVASTRVTPEQRVQDDSRRLLSMQGSPWLMRCTATRWPAV